MPKTYETLTAECPAINAAIGAALVAQAEMEAARLRLCGIVDREDEELEPYYVKLNEAEEAVAETVPTTLLGVKRLAEWLANFDPHRNASVNEAGPKTLLAGIEGLLKEARA